MAAVISPGRGTVRGWVDLAWRTAMTVWSWGIFGLSVIVWSILVIPVMALVSLVLPAARNLATDWTQAGVGLYVRLLPFIRVEVDRRRGLATGTRIFVVNHQSFIDPLVIFSFEKRMRGPARGYLLRTPFLRTYLKFAGFYLSDRGAPAPLEAMRRATEQAIACGGSLLFYPEGTRSKTGDVGDFRVGAFRIAAEYQLPVQPVVVEGLDRAYPSGSVVVRTGWRYPVRVRYLDPILPPFGHGTQRKVVRSLTERVRASMVGELQEMRAERYREGAPDVGLVEPPSSDERTARGARRRPNSQESQCT